MRGLLLAAAKIRFEPADRDVVATAERWRDCLTQTGPSAGAALPDDPMSLLLPNDDRAPVAVTDAGRQFAQTDVDCQPSSGYRSALHRAQWRKDFLVSIGDAVGFSSPRADQVAPTADAGRGLLLDANCSDNAERLPEAVQRPAENAGNTIFLEHRL